MKNLLFNFKNIDTNLLKISKIGIRYSFLITIFSVIILLIYTYINSSINLYYIGLNLLKLSFTCISAFIINTLIFDKIKKDLLL